MSGGGAPDGVRRRRTLVFLLEFRAIRAGQPPYLRAIHPTQRSDAIRYVDDANRTIVRFRGENDGPFGIQYCAAVSGGRSKRFRFQSGGICSIRRTFHRRRGCCASGPDAMRQTSRSRPYSGMCDAARQPSRSGRSSTPRRVCARPSAQIRRCQLRRRWSKSPHCVWLARPPGWSPVNRGWSPTRQVGTNPGRCGSAEIMTMQLGTRRAVRGRPASEYATQC